MLAVYKWMLNIFGWNNFIARQPEDLRQKAGEFMREFSAVGTSSAFLTLILFAILGLVLYYFVFTKFSSKRIKYRYRLTWWLVWFFLTSILTMAITPLMMRLFMSWSDFLAGKFFWAVSLCNLIYSLIIFFIGSLIIKQFPKFTDASCTPFNRLKK